MQKKFNKAIILSTTAILLILLSVTTVSADVQHEQKELGQSLYILPPDFTPFDPTIIDFTLPYNLIFPGNEYFIWDDHGGWWYDVEKTYTNTDDDLMCWAAACSNTMEYTGWATVSTFTSTDDAWQHYLEHWQDLTGLMVYGYEWWFADGNPNGRVDVTGGGNFFPPPDYNYQDYYHETWTNDETVEKIDEWLHAGYATSIGIRPGVSGGHAITVWGFSYDPLAGEGSKAYYTGLYVTDSDDNNGIDDPSPAPNTLRYYTLDWDEDQGRWELTDYGGGWWIDLVSAIEPRPGYNRPTAAVAAFDPVYEGSPLTLNGASSSDLDGDSLKYRWDFDEDNLWDEAWTTTPTESYTWNDNGQVTVLLEVFDGTLKDTQEITVNVLNAAPTVNAGSDTTAYEGTTILFSGNFNDPGTLDTHTIEWSFGDGETATGSLDTSHSYADNGVYTVTLKVTDDDGGVGQDTLTVTVTNVAPVVEAGVDQTADEGQTVNLDPASFTDPGTADTHTAQIDWGDGTVDDGTVAESSGSGTVTGSHNYGDNGVYTVTVTVTDDDGGASSDTLTVTVTNVAPTVTEVGLDQPNEQFILPSVHAINFTATYTDPGWLDTHTASWNWGDGSPLEAGTVTETAGSGTVTGSHIYSTPGDYTVSVTVTDDDLGHTTKTLTLHVVTPEEAVQDMNNYIQDLPDEAFDKKPSQTKKTLDNMLNAVLDKLLLEEYNGAINQLTSIRGKMCGDKNDWITDPEALIHLQMKINDITTYLQNIF